MAAELHDCCTDPADTIRELRAAHPNLSLESVVAGLRLEIATCEELAAEFAGDDESVEMYRDHAARCRELLRGVAP